MSVCKQVCIGTVAWLYSVLMLESDTTGVALTLDPIFDLIWGLSKISLFPIISRPTMLLMDLWGRVSSYWSPLSLWAIRRQYRADESITVSGFLWVFVGSFRKFILSAVHAVCVLVWTSMVQYWCQHMFKQIAGAWWGAALQHTTLCMCLKIDVVRPISCEITLVRSPNFVFSRLRRV
jgi:hypothetical protein